MEAEELRLGNYLYYRDKSHLLQVSNIGSNGFETVDENGLLYGSDDILDYNPIPLTEQLLLDFGFKPFSNDFSKNGIVIHTRKRGYVLKKTVPDIKHAHQLQNLYFSLTGKELRIKTTSS